MRIGVIVDEGGLARWQADALRQLELDTEFIVYDCQNSRPEKRRGRFALYYLLNLFTIRNPLTRKVPFPAELRVVANRPFQSEWDAAWQSLPHGLLQAIREDAPEVLVKFGMGLLRVPERAELRVPILSYHHGDPLRFRGRPAGFYELLSGEPVMGQVVQVLSNALDAGQVVAAAETKVVPHSYRATLMEAYRVSLLLLLPAIRRALAGAGAEPAERGTNYRLPGNSIVVRFVVHLVAQASARIGYGLFREKLWRVTTVASEPSIPALSAALKDRSSWSDLAVRRGFRFLADPFFHPAGGILVEALNERSGTGQLVHVTGDQENVISGRGGHFSYPSVVEVSGSCYVIPEVSDWSEALAFPLRVQTLGEPFALRIRGRPRLLDPTAFSKDGTIYLFANSASDGGSVLRLWFADAIDGEFVEHPCSPIRISPEGGRMGGSLAVLDGRLIRIGQDFRGAYGDGLAFFHVTRIDREQYVEERVGSVKLSGVAGPHTLNVAGGRAVFDYYTHRSSPLAGLRRLRERRAARRITG